MVNFSVNLILPSLSCVTDEIGLPYPFTDFGIAASILFELFNFPPSLN